MKRFYKIFASWFLCLFLVLSQFIVSFADVNSLMISTSSNALMTLELDDSDYSVMPMSTLGTVSNTIQSDELYVRVYYHNTSTGTSHWVPVYCPLINGRYRLDFKLNVPGYIYNIQPFLYSDDLPSPGSYKFSLDYASDFAYDYDSTWYEYTKTFRNASNSSGRFNFAFSQFSGDLYVSPQGINLTNLYRFIISFIIDESASLNQVGGSLSIHFERTEFDSSYPSTGDNTSSEDYQDDVSSSLSDLSSSVDSMTEDLSSAVENLEYISTSQNLIIQGIDNVVMHISDQLFAFWNQLFNLIHVPTMAKMDDIISAINNMDLEIEVNLDGLKTSINNMSTAVQNKLQSTTDKITGGYDNSGITQENEKLEQSINQYDDVESGIFEDAEGFIGDFEYPSIDSLPLGIIKTLAFVGSFLQGIFICMGEFSVIITFSLTMIFVMVVVGYHRIRS